MVRRNKRPIVILARRVAEPVRNATLKTRLIAELDFPQYVRSDHDYAWFMIFFSKSRYSERTYARFRAALALERFTTAPHTCSRASALRWARAWNLALHADDD